MTNNIDFEVIISTCDKYSDLWDAHVLLMNQNWTTRRKTWLVTDAPTQRSLDGVELICAGVGTEITQRLKVALERVEAEYILFTLDDYFLTMPINEEALQRSLSVMREENLDYMLLFPSFRFELRREGAVEIPGHPGYYLRDTSEGNYKISLYPGLWRTDFMRKTLDKPLNAWQYEVALTPMAHQMNARCAISNNHEFPFLDVIRKGKVLRKADRYFQRNPIYQSNRPVRTVWEEVKLDTRTWIGRVLPKPLFKAAKRLMIKLGMEFYSPVK